MLVRVVDAKDKKAVADLASALNCKDIENRRNAALALSNIGGDDSAVGLPILLEAAKNGDVELRRMALLAIRNIGPAAANAVPDLIGYLRNDKDAKTRECACRALGGIGALSESAVPILVGKIKDTNENTEVRIECAMALQKIGPVSAAVDAVPELLAVLGDTSQNIRVRERIMWALRAHTSSLRTIDGPKDAFAAILKEPLSKNGDNKMLRYDCAYMLGMIWQKDAPDDTLNVLHDFLCDETIKVFTGVVTKAGGISVELRGEKGKSNETSKGDGRVMAVDALKAMGPRRYAPRAEIMRQLGVLGADRSLYEPLRTKAAELVKDKDAR